MKLSYTAERNFQILIALLKAHNIRKVIVSPGTTNMSLVGSIQQDPYFELYSSVDERSAAYMACGLAAESGEPVALSCTGATASRNYMSGLTEAYYRKLPVLAITSSRHSGMIGQGMDQVTDRRCPPKDVQKLSVQIPMIHTLDDEWAANVKINTALLELRRNGGGPVHINIETSYSTDFSVPKLPEVRVIHRACLGDTLPPLMPGRIGIFAGAHRPFSPGLTQAIDAFCEAYHAVVFCDHCSGYKGKYRVFPTLVTTQRSEQSIRLVDTLIYIGEVAVGKLWLKPSMVWRVSPDGEVRDPFRNKLQWVFQMEEEQFFASYAAMVPQDTKSPELSQLQEWENLRARAEKAVPDLPFSNIWIAQHTANLLPQGSVLHLGILNSARSWNHFEVPRTVDTYVNTGGYGIDGCVSSLLGASLANRGRLHFGVVGDLAFFYDMNSLGNRHVGPNLRLMVVNNGCGTEFRMYNHPCVKSGFGEEIAPYMAAAGHFGNQSRELVRHYAEDLGFEYFCAGTKEEYLGHRERFLTPTVTERPMLFEVFTKPRDESEALEKIRNLVF